MIVQDVSIIVLPTEITLETIIMVAVEIIAEAQALTRLQEETILTIRLQEETIMIVVLHHHGITTIPTIQTEAMTILLEDTTIIQEEITIIPIVIKVQQEVMSVAQVLHEVMTTQAMTEVRLLPEAMTIPEVMTEVLPQEETIALAVLEVHHQAARQEEVQVEEDNSN